MDCHDARTRSAPRGLKDEADDEPVLPALPRDETDADWGERSGERDADWYRRERPPHHE